MDTQTPLLGDRDTYISSMARRTRQTHTLQEALAPYLDLKLLR